MGWSRNRRRRTRSAVGLANRPAAVEPMVVQRVRSTTAPRDTRPRSLVPPGESRYHKAGGLRSRLADAAARGEDIHVTVDLTDLRRRTVR